MWRINQFDLEPGVYVCKDVRVVVTEIQTHTTSSGYPESLEQPVVIYRDLAPGAEKYITYGMPLNNFNQLFAKVK